MAYIGVMVMHSRLAWLLAFSLSTTALAQESASVKDRLREIERLSEQGRSALAQLGNYLRDPEVRVRREAVRAIVKIDTADSLDLLVEASRDADPEVQIWAADGMVNFYLPGYIKMGLTAPLKRFATAVKGRFTDVNDQVIPPDVTAREDVIAALGRLARGGTSMESRAHAARALGVLRGRQAIPDLLEALRSKDSQVLYESLIALQKIQDTSVGPKIRFLLRDPDNRVQIAAIETAGLLRDFGALPELYEVLERARNIDVQRAALTAIAMLPDEKSRPTFERYLEHRDPRLRAAAAEGIGRLGNPSDIPRLEQLFNGETKMNPRLSLAFALVKLGKTEPGEFSPLQYLVSALNLASFKGVARAFLLELAREPMVRQSLYQALEAATTEEKLELAGILGLSGGPDAEAPLEKLARDADAKVSTAALKALAVLRSRLGKS